MEYEKYIIKKGKTDMLSSLKQVNKKIIKRTMENFDVDSIKKLSKTMIDEFQMILSTCTDDLATRIFFKNLVEHENSDIFSAYNQDIENFNVFVYKKDNHLSYYIPDELRKIIKKELGF